MNAEAPNDRREDEKQDSSCELNCMPHSPLKHVCNIFILSVAFNYKNLWIEKESKDVESYS